MNKIEYKNISAFHPGYYIKDIIDDMEITQDEFAKRLNVTGKVLSNLINGKIPLSNNVAKNLSLMFGTSINVWLNLQTNFDEKKLEIEKEKQEEKEQQYLEKLDYKYFQGLNLVPKTSNKAERVKNLLAFFRVTSLGIMKRKDLLVQFRKNNTKINEDKIFFSNVWVQTIINLGKDVETKPFNKKALQLSLKEIRNLTILPEKEVFEKLPKLLANCGIALVMVPSMKNSGIYAAVKWVNKDKVILGLTNRGKYSDIFWFSLFHEIGHIFDKNKKALISYENDEISDDKHEKDEISANNFAKDTLIPYEDYKNFLSNNKFTEESIKNFASSININPAIVVGRLQKENIIKYNQFNNLRNKYENYL